MRRMMEKRACSCCCASSLPRYWPRWAMQLPRKVCVKSAPVAAVESLVLQALRISGFPSPCAEGRCAGSGCTKAKLRAWRAVLLLLQVRHRDVLRVIPHSLSLLCS